MLRLIVGLLALAVICSALPMAERREMKKEQSRRFVNELRRTVNKASYVVKRSLERKQSGCPTTPLQQRSTVYPCITAYSESMSTIEGQDIMSNPAVRETYCEAIIEAQACVEEALVSCSAQEIATSELGQYTDMLNGSRNAAKCNDDVWSLQRNG